MVNLFVEAAPAETRRYSLKIESVRLKEVHQLPTTFQWLELPRGYANWEIEIGVFEQEKYSKYLTSKL